LLSLKKISAKTIPVVWAGGFLLLDDVSALTLVHNHYIEQLTRRAHRTQAAF